MKWKWIILAIIVVVVIGGLVILSFIPRITIQPQKPLEPEPFDAFNIEYILVDESEYDPAYYYANYDLINDSPITDVRFINGNEQFNELAEQGKFLKPASLDCEKYYCVVTYGRKIVDLRVERLKHCKLSTIPKKGAPPQAP